MQTILRSKIFLPQQSDFSRTDWSRARVLTRKWRDGGAIAFSLSLGRDFPRNVNENGRQNLSNWCYCGKQIDNNFPWSILLSTIEVTSRSSIFSKLYRQTTKPAVRGSTWVFNILTSFLWLVRVENCCPCINYLLAAFISCFNLFWFRWFIRSDSQHA